MLNQDPLPASFEGEDRISLCETLDRVLNKGVVLAGEVLISVAGVDLIYLGLHVMLSSVETARGLSPAQQVADTLCTGAQT